MCISSGIHPCARPSYAQWAALGVRIPTVGHSIGLPNEWSDGFSLSFVHAALNRFIRSSAAMPVFRSTHDESPA